MTRSSAWIVGCVVACVLAAGRPHPAAQGPNAALAGPLAHCLPGALFTDCQSALDAASVAHITGQHDTATRRAVPLHAPWIALDINAPAATGGRITEVRFQGTLHAGVPRRRLLDFFVAQLHDHAYAASALNLGCGTSDAGPAWFATEAERVAARPRLQIAIDRFPTIRGGFGTPIDRAFIDTVAPDQSVFLCSFATPPVDASDPYVAALAAYIASPSF